MLRGTAQFMIATAVVIAWAGVQAVPTLTHDTFSSVKSPLQHTSAGDFPIQDSVFPGYGNPEAPDLKGGLSGGPSSGWVEVPWVVHSNRRRGGGMKAGQFAPPNPHAPSAAHVSLTGEDALALGGCTPPNGQAR